MRGVYGCTRTPQGLKKSSNLRFRVCAQKSRKLSSCARATLGPEVYTYTLTPIVGLLVLAGAVLATSAKPARGRPKWLPPVNGVNVGECAYCKRPILAGYADGGVPVALDLRLVRTDLEELAYLLRGIVCYWLWRHDGKRWHADTRNQFTMRGPRPELVFPWHQCPAGKWRWSS